MKPVLDSLNAEKALEFLKKDAAKKGQLLKVLMPVLPKTNLMY
jgi:uncharacterized protein YlaN (UPF0358 family)